ncbi:MAG: AMP-dependent synthetase, partial [Clostridiales bacterium]|nr:AMP-dependent synthetase [Clostridiales bacterium]
VSKFGDAAGFKYKDNEGRIVCKTYTEFGKDIDFLGTALLSLGLKNSKISIIGENRYEWGVCFFSVANGTGVAVPLDKYLPKNEIENLIVRGKVEAIFYSPAFHSAMTEIAKTNTFIKYYICMEENKEGQFEDSRFTSLPLLIRKGEELIKSGDSSFTEVQLDREALSVLLFTSGTTSISKGVMLSHANFASNVHSIETAIKVSNKDVYLSLLPLHHTFENTIGLMFMVHSGVCICYSDGIKHIPKNLIEYGVTILVAVPAILEAMYRKVGEGIKKSGKAKLLNTLMNISDLIRNVGIDVRRKLFKSVFAQLGPNLRLAVSGAAPLDPEVVTGFDRLGLKLIQGYGLTETSPVIAANNDFVNKTGTVGYPLEGIEIAIDTPDENGMGEIITRGNNVMLGYYENSEATLEVIDAEGWFRTGDLGVIDGEGFLKITGRAKSMIVFTNGKKAFPEEYEVLLNNIPGVKDSFAWGNVAPDGDIQVCAELVVDNEYFTAEENEIPNETKLAELFDAAIREINKTIPQYKIIRYFILTNNDLVKTTTLKIKRPLEYERIKELLDKAGVEMRKASGKFIENL